MSRRAAAVAETRRRIVGAARELHSERGIAATSWDDIAARAGVGVGTVYRHFPTLDELIPACGAVVADVLALPSPAEATALFAGVVDPAARVERLVGEVFAIYARAPRELRAIRRESDVHPGVADSARSLARSLRALVDAALEPVGATREDRRVVRAMIDLGTWEALREQGLAQGAAVATVAGMLSARLASRRRG